MRSSAHVDPLTRQFPAFRSTGRIIRRPPWGRVKLAPIHSVISWKFPKFSLRAGATVVHGLFEFRSVNLRFEPFVWLFDRWSKVFLLITRSLFGGSSSSFVCLVVRGGAVVSGEVVVFFEGLWCS